LWPFLTRPSQLRLNLSGQTFARSASIAAMVQTFSSADSGEDERRFRASVHIPDDRERPFRAIGSPQSLVKGFCEC
jgi:hypothetical protein